METKYYIEKQNYVSFDGIVLTLMHLELIHLVGTGNGSWENQKLLQKIAELYAISVMSFFNDGWIPLFK